MAQGVSTSHIQSNVLKTGRTGDPNCPHHVEHANHIRQRLIKEAHVSTKNFDDVEDAQSNCPNLQRVGTKIKL